MLLKKDKKLKDKFKKKPTFFKILQTYWYEQMDAFKSSNSTIYRISIPLVYWNILLLFIFIGVKIK